MPNKALPAKIKADNGPAGDAPGTFTAIVAAYNTDSGGDKIVPGAFGKSLASWQESGNRIPVVWSHQHNDAFSYIGEVLEASETEDGLVIKGQLDIEDNQYAAQVHRLIKGGRINNYSFAYEVNDSAPAPKDDSDGAHTLLKELDLIEAGPTLVGMNRNTRTLDVKSSAKPGDKLAKAVPGSFEALQDALTDALTAGAGTDGFAWPIATYDDHVVYRLSGAVPSNGCETYSATYSINADGTISLGDPTEVEINEMVAPAPKATAPEQKVGRSLSAATETQLRQALEAIQGVLGAPNDDAAPSGDDGKSTEPESAEPAQTSGPVSTDDDPDANTEQVDEPAGKLADAHTRVPAEVAFDPEFEAAFLAALDPS